MTTVTVKGMSCQHCVKAVTQALESVEGVEKVKVNLDSGQASFEETTPVDRETIRQAVVKAGYDLA